MKLEGGDGIVLLAARREYNWLVTKDRRTTDPGHWTFGAELAHVRSGRSAPGVDQAVYGIAQTKAVGNGQAHPE